MTSRPPHRLHVRRSSPPIRQRLLGLTAVVLTSALLAPPAHAADPAKPATAAEARDRRDAIKREQADIASQLVPLEATEDQLEQALSAITAHVQAQQWRVTDMTKNAEDAHARAESLATEVRDLETGIASLERQVRDRAIAAYTAPDGRSTTEELLFRSADLMRAERQRALIDEVNGSDEDVRDRLRGERVRIAELRVEADRAATESAKARAESEEALRVLADAHEKQRQIKAAIDDRIAGYKTHALQLASEDADLERIISDLTYRAQVQANGPPQQGPVGDGAPGNITGAVGPGGMIWPIAGRLTQGFGVNGHPGIDVAAPMNTPIYAAKGGRVIFAGWNNGGYGNLVMVDHGDVVTAYAHQNHVVASVGQEVTQGQLLGYEGSTGYSTGPHLHFEVRIGGGKANPLSYLP